MCKSKLHGGKRCKITATKRKAINAKRREKYRNKKEEEQNNDRIDAGTARNVPHSSGLEQGHAGSGSNPLGGSLAGPHDSNGTGFESRLNIHGHSVRIVGKTEPPAKRAEQLRAMGKSTPVLNELHPEDVGVFHQRISELNEGNKWFASVYIYPLEEYKDMRVFLTDDGESGIAMKEDGDIVSVFSSPLAKDRQSANSMIATMVSLGGKKLDCFDTVLPVIYAQEGFIEAGRDSWNEDYKPEGWEYDTYKNFNNGRPDVVYMEYREDSIGSVYISPNAKAKSNA